MTTRYIMPLGFIDRLTEDGATFILTKPGGFPEPQARHPSCGMALLARASRPRQTPGTDNRGRLHHRHLRHR